MSAGMLKDLTALMRAAMAAARATTPDQATRKAHQDFVTNVDLQIDALLEERLSALLPGCPVLSEERAADHPAPVARYWIVDPIDGTLNMMAGLVSYGISVALVDGEGPELAVVGDIAQDRIFIAARGQGAWCDDVPLRLETAPPPPLVVVSTGLLDELVTGDPARFTALRKVGKIRNFGAQSLHLCEVATGALAGVLSIEARVWDEAAGGLILREAGGVWQARSDGADWHDPAALMALPAQRSCGAHPSVAADLAAVMAREARSALPVALLGLDRKARRIAPLPQAQDLVTGLCAWPVGSGPDTGPDWSRTQIDCPPDIALDSALELGLRLQDGSEHWTEITPATLPDCTGAAIHLSRVIPDLARGRLEILGWALGGGDRPRIWGVVNGGAPRRLPMARRPDVAAQNSFVPAECGFRGTLRFDDAEMAHLRAGTLALELRLELGPRIAHVVPVPVPDPAEHEEALAIHDIQTRIAARAARIPRWRLERLVASEAFRRRWALSEDSLAWIARGVIAEALVARLTPGDTLWIRLYNGDLVICQPLEDTILARKFLSEAGDERGFLDWLSGRLGPGDIAMDIGAAYGVVSRIMARDGAQVIAIEADPTSAARIRQSGLEFAAGRIDLLECAVSDTVGTVTFAGMGRTCVGSGKIIASDRGTDVAGFLDEISQINQVPLAPDAVAQKERKTFARAEVDILEVPATTIDTICQERALRDVAFVKMDIEGGELMALRGAMGLLDGAFGTPPVVAFEYSTLFPMRGGAHEEVLEIFLSRGWRLCHLRGGKSHGGALVDIRTAADAPGHDNILAFPPARDPA